MYKFTFVNFCKLRDTIVLSTLHLTTALWSSYIVHELYTKNHEQNPHEHVSLHVVKLKLTFRLSSCRFWAWFKACSNCDAAFKRFFSSIEASSQKWDRIFSEGIFIFKKSQENIVNNIHARVKSAILDFTETALGRKEAVWASNHTRSGNYASLMRRASFDEEHPLTIARADFISGWWKWETLLQRKGAGKRANCCNSRD